MIYFDNAATGGFKPSASISAAISAIKNINANPGRSSHRLSVLGEQLIFEARSKLSETFNNRHIERVIFTKNCTEALNTAIFGIVKPNSEVVTTITEHNSVLRPLYALKRNFGVKIKFAVPKNGKFITEADVLPLITRDTSLVVMNAVSNVTGQKNEFENIGKKIDVPLLIDGAQAAGHMRIDLEHMGICALAVAGHKGLYGTAGSGALIFDEKTEIQPLMFGGSGTDTFEEYPKFYPEKLECGTLNLPAICSLSVGTEFAHQQMEQSQRRLLSFTTHLACELEKIGAKVFSSPNQFGIVAFSLDNQSSMEVGDLLSTNFDIAVRGGFHCAPLMHKFLGTDDGGLVRVSLAPQNTESEMDKFLSAVKHILKFGY